MRTSLVSALAVSITAIGFTGCSSFRAGSKPETKMPHRVHLDALTRAQYTISDPVVTTSCAKQVALWPIPIWWAWHPKAERDDARFGTPNTSAGGLASGFTRKNYRVEFFRGARDKAQESASQKALEELSGVDVVFSPGYVSEEKYIRWWRRDVCVVTSTTGAHFKREAEMGAKEKAQRPNTTATVDATGPAPSGLIQSLVGG